MKQKGAIHNMAKILIIALVLSHAALAIAEWTDISGAIAAREAAWTPVATGVSENQFVGATGVDEGSAEYISDGRVFDTFFWYEAYSEFIGISYNPRPGFTIVVW